MAFGVSKRELFYWKQEAENGEIAFLTHFWYDERFPHCTTITKVACNNLRTLEKWGEQYGLKPEWIHEREDYPHFDLLGEKQREILEREGRADKLNKLLQKDKLSDGGGSYGYHPK